MDASSSLKGRIEITFTALNEFESEIKWDFLLQKINSSCFFFCLIPYLHKISLALDGSFFLYHADNVSSKFIY